MHGDTPAGRRRLRDRRVLPEPARPRRRLAVAQGRRGAAHGRARRLLHEPRRRDPHNARVTQDHQRRRQGHRRRDRGRALRGPTRRRRRDAERAHAPRGPPEVVPGRARPLPDRRVHGEGRLGAGRPDPVGEPGRHRRRHRPRRRAPRASSCTRSSRRTTASSDHPFLLLGQQSVADPTRAPAGKHTAWAYTHGPQRGVDWVRDTPLVAERMEAQVERFAPGFRDRILARHIQSPADLEARNPNLIGGDVGGGSYRLNQVVFRPLPEAHPVLDPAQGPVHRQRRDLPGRRRPRCARRRRRPCRAPRSPLKHSDTPGAAHPRHHPRCIAHASTNS